VFIASDKHPFSNDTVKTNNNDKELYGKRLNKKKKEIKPLLLRLPEPLGARLPWLPRV